MNNWSSERLKHFKPSSLLCTYLKILKKLIMHLKILIDDLKKLSLVQIVDVCQDWEKESKLARLLEEIGSDGHSKILVFVETKRKCDELTR